MNSGIQYLEKLLKFFAGNFGLLNNCKESTLGEGVGSTMQGDWHRSSGWRIIQIM